MDCIGLRVFTVRLGRTRVFLGPDPTIDYPARMCAPPVIKVPVKFISTVRRDVYFIRGINKVAQLQIVKTLK